MKVAPSALIVKRTFPVLEPPVQVPVSTFPLADPGPDVNQRAPEQDVIPVLRLTCRPAEAKVARVASHAMQFERRAKRGGGVIPDGESGVAPAQTASPPASESMVQGPPIEGASSVADSILALQRSVGNVAVGNLVARQPTGAQAKERVDPDVTSAARILAPVAGVDRHTAEEIVVFAATGLGLSPKALKSAAEGIARLSRLKGRPLYEGALQLSTSELEVYWSLAGGNLKNARVERALRLVRDLRNKLYWDLGPILEADGEAESALFEALPATELERVWVDVESAGGMSADLKDRLKSKVGAGLRKDASGGSADAELERDRGRRAGEQLEQRVKGVGEEVRFARQDVLRLIREAVGHVDKTKGSLVEIAKLYADAHEQVVKTIEEAKAEAAIEERKMDMMLDIAIGVGVVMSLGAALPLAEGASEATHLLIETAGKITEVAIGDVVKGGGSAPAEPRASDFEKAHPDIKEVEAYKRCGELYRTLALLSGSMDPIGNVGDVVDTVRADARELAVAGVHRTMVIPELERKVRGLEGVGSGLKGVVGNVRDVSLTTEAAAVGAERSAKLVDERRMWKQIWIHWLASLKGDDATLPGQEPIKSALNSLAIVAEDGEDTVIGWGVGLWHSDANSRTGVKKARVYAKALDLVGHEGRLVKVISSRVFEAVGDFEPRSTPGGGPLGEHTQNRMGTLGKVAVGSGKDDVYTVQVMDTADAGDSLTISGVIARDDKGLYVDGNDPADYGPVLIARRTPRSGEEAMKASKDDWEPSHAI